MWTITTLGELTQGPGGLIQTGPFGSQLHASDYSNRGVAVVMPQDIRDGFVDHQAIAHVPKSTAGELARHQLFQGDIVYSRRGDVEKCAIIRAADLPAICGTGCLLVRLPTHGRASGTFLNYRLRMPETRAWIKGHAVGATMPNLNTEILRAVPLDLPSTAEQQAIAEVLGALDDKIAANAALRDVCRDLTALLFNRSFGERPSQPLEVVAEVNADTVKPGTGDLRYLDIASVVEGSYVYPALSLWSEAPSRARRRVRHGDTVWSTVRPNRRSHALVLEDDPLLVASTGLVTITPRHEGFSFVHEATRTTAFTDHLVAHAVGSAYPAVNASKVANAPVPLATTLEIKEFDSVCDSIWERAEATSRESRVLAELRDTLLPALMDGTIRVKDAVAAAEEVL